MTEKDKTPASRPARKPYHAPRLEYLGSARDLTLGTATAGAPDVKSMGQKGG